MHAYEKLLRDSYAAFNARELDAAMKALGPDVEWPDQLEGVTLQGPDAVGAYWGRQWAVLDPHFDLKHVAIEDNDRVVLTLVQSVSGKDGQLILKGLVRHVYDFEDGLVRRMHILL